jgi:hypothetical protein
MRNLTKIWGNMSSYAATMGLTPMTTHYLDLFNYEVCFITRRMAEGNVDVTVYVAIPLTGPDAVMQVYMYTGMPFPVKPSFFVNIESNFQCHLFVFQSHMPTVNKLVIFKAAQDTQGGDDCKMGKLLKMTRKYTLYFLCIFLLLPHALSLVSSLKP